jgi:hypothetical protein
MRRFGLIRILVVVLSLRAQTAFTAPNEISFDPREGLLWIKATVQSGESLNLLLDTGAAVSVLNTTAAKRLTLGLGPRITVCGVESTLTGFRVKPVRLTADGFSLPAPSLAVDLQKLSSSCSQPLDGLLGADFFRGRIVQIDFEAAKLRILNASSVAADSACLPLQMRPCGMRIPVTINGRKSQWLRLDTGCVSPLQWVTTKIRPEDCIRKTAIGLAERSIPQTETTVQIGPYQFQRVPTGIHEKPIFQGEAGLLGNGVLSRFSRITINAKSGGLILEPRPSTP